MFTLLLGVVVSFVGLASDVGVAYRNKASDQSAADAAAHAGALALVEGESSDATAEAISYALANDVAANEVTVNIPPSSGAAAGDDSCVEVEVDTDSPALFSRVLDFDLFPIAVRSVACANGGEPFTGVMPWAILEDAIEYDGSPSVLKYDSNNGSNGNYGALRMFGNGSKNYENNIKYGVQGSVCAASQPSCDNPFEDTESGNMTGGTRDGVNYRLSATIEECDEFDEAFAPDGIGGYDLIDECNPFMGVQGSNRVLLIPVVDSFCNGHCTVTLEYFVLVFLNDLDKCKGNSCEVTATFVAQINDPETELGILPGEPIGGSVAIVE